MTLKLEWPAPYSVLRLRNGIGSLYLGVCPLTQKRRCATYKDRGVEIDPPTDPDMRNKVSYTVWLLNDAGQCNVTGLVEDERDWLGKLVDA